MLRIALQNLIQDRLKLAIMLTGVTLAVLLMIVQSGLYDGYMNAVSGIIDHNPADLWIVAAGSLNSDAVAPFPEELSYRIRATPGIAWADRMTHGWAVLHLPDGSRLWGQVVGFNPETGVGAPPEIAQGSITDLRRPGTYLVDEASLPLMQGAGPGSLIENLGQRMEIVGVSRGLKSYNTYPILYASVHTAQQQTATLENNVQFVVAKLEEGADAEIVRERLRANRYYDVHTRDEFRDMVRHYWATRTGIGLGIGTTVILGFIVGMVIAGQTLYSSTVEKLHEYATLKAMGATNMEICSMLWLQAAIIGGVGYAAGSIAALLLRASATGQVIALDYSREGFGVIFAATMLMCFGASLFSVMRVLRVDPASVFRTNG